jgi:DNA-binding transcriptional MerR regulator
MKIGELSRRTGVSVRMLRYYEDAGLLAPPRTTSGYRDYGPAEEQIVRRIKLLGAAGMTLETIQRLLPCVRNNDPEFTPCNELRRILAEQVDLINERIETLSQSRTILAGYLASVN